MSVWKPPLGIRVFAHLTRPKGDLPSRAIQLRSDLDSGELRRQRAAFHNLVRDQELTEEENAVLPQIRRLVRRTLDLAADLPEAREVATEILASRPLARLACAIVHQGHVVGSSEVLAELGPPGSPVRVMATTREGTRELMTIPISLREPLLGQFFLMGEISPDRMRRVVEPDRLPPHYRLEVDSSRIRVTYPPTDPPGSAMLGAR